MRFVLLVFALVVAPGLHAQPCDGAAQLADAAPVFAEITAGVPATRAILEAYACALVDLDSEARLRAVLVERDTVIARVGPLIEGWQERVEAGSGDASGVYEALDTQSQALAVRVVGAEGFLFGLTYAAFAPSVRTLASPALTLHLDALVAEGGTVGGEYPYGSLDAEVDLIVAAEALRARFPASPYVSTGQPAFGRALLDLASLHPVAGLDNLDTWFAGVATNEFYPWAGDREALVRFVAEATDSRYHAPLAAILADPPESAAEGEIEVLIVARETTREAAEARALEWLDGSVDVVGVLAGDASAAVVYRYAPTGDARLDAWALRARAQGLAPERVRVDVAELWGF